jgi:hypothetical protein
VNAIPECVASALLGALTASRPVVVLGWTATLVMGAAALRMFIHD